MIQIKIPNNNIPERTYILDVIFGEFLDLKYTIQIGSNDYEIILKNKKKLIVRDNFFSRYPNDLEYLKMENIPSKLEDMDIFAICFFMLTRWEEYVNKNRDIHNRFPAYESLAYKEGFLGRPVVNEYIEILKQQLLELDNSLVFKEKKFELVLTHDVDELIMWKSWKHVFRVVIGDILKRKDIKLGLSRIYEYFLIRQNKMKDPFDTFDWLMEVSEKIGVKSRFYFMSGGITKYDNRYKIDDEKVISIIKHIQARGHIVGIHPSYNAYNSYKQFEKEKKILESVCGCSITEGREHYLRFEVPTTWQIWADNNMKLDSTCGYADMEGFRCGTGDEFSVFNILTRQKLILKERPLIYMDDNRPEGNRIYDEEILIRNIKMLENQNRKYNSKHTLLFHQSIFAMDKIDYKGLYEKIIK